MICFQLLGSGPCIDCIQQRIRLLAIAILLQFLVSPRMDVDKQHRCVYSCLHEPLAVSQTDNVGTVAATLNPVTRTTPLRAKKKGGLIQATYSL